MSCVNSFSIKNSQLKVQYNPYSEDDGVLWLEQNWFEEKAEEELGFKYKYELRGLQS